MDVITNLVAKGNSFLWSFLLIVLLCGTGIYYTIRLRFIQVRKFGEGWKLVFGHLSTRPFVDRNLIGVIGICGSGSFAISAAKIPPVLRRTSRICLRPARWKTSLKTRILSTF